MIHVFETKYASNQFLYAFVEKFKNIKYKTQNTGQGEQFYQNTWPNFKDDLEEGDEIAFQGIIRNTHTLKKYFDKHNWYYFDQPYFFASHYQKHPEFNDIWYRVIKNNTQKNYIDTNPKHKKRFEKIQEQTAELKLKPWRKDSSNSHILVIPPSQHTARWYGLCRHEWETEIVKELKKHTNRPIKVRHKFVDNADFGQKVHKPLQEDLQGCWAIVSWHSMCASEAVVKGIPSFSSKHSPAAPVSYSLQELDKIEKPKMPDRELWLYSLLGSQFTLSEMKSGFAYKYINEEKIYDKKNN